MIAVRERSRGETAERWGSILVGLAVLGVVSWMTYGAMTARPLPIKKENDAAAASLTGQATAASATTAAATSSSDAGALDLDAGFSLGSLSLDAALLPSSAPRHVKLGVVLVSFQGAEGAPPNARNKRDAQSIAERLGADARSDFKHAVTGGDPGSSEDIGRIPRGVLDPRTEAAVFALSTGEISDVLETPRGFWIVKRIE